jgi:ribosome biogenesis GTPase
LARFRPENTRGRPGRIVEIAGRRVWVRDDEGERLCFLSGQRAVVGDLVRWIEAAGEGGKLLEVLPRRTTLRRFDPRGEEQVLAANLAGLLVVVAATDPPLHAALLDRYAVAASQAGLDVAICLTKIDLGVPADAEIDLALRERHGLPVLRVSVPDGTGLDALRSFLALRAVEGPWALVGHSGVGKTSLVAALLPGTDVGPIGAISEYWGTGRHTTTQTRLFTLPGGGEIADSPGIRAFVPAGLGAEDVRDHFPGMRGLPCKYRDCLHRPDEAGCVADASIEAALVASYRRLLEEVEVALRRRAPR